MIIVAQRVLSSSVAVDGQTVGSIGKGLMLLVGVHKDDAEDAADLLAVKCADLRIFSDSGGKMNLSVNDIGGEALVVSQFTLLGNCSKGRRPSFVDAAPSQKGRELYEYFVKKLREKIRKVETGIFGADMKVQLVNDGPVTVIINS
ncbi:MAG: D-tyrosyl-tRNA(Tyr) deacylase [Chitinispirillales bacterium]|jgi:D-tyrosyl-tRNA(Tyr) deacylase|nr:D-tyrosyl-tRNA(Tyr) deacylase [Chitinispirillales bacterium]